jgi:programmed cell death 6-interacting protein
MLSLPLNVHVSSLDPVKPFTKFIESFVKGNLESSETKNNLLKDIHEYNSVRENAIRVVESNEVGIQFFLRYDYQMSSISKKISGYESELKLAFQWADPFRTKKTFTQNSFYFDWACVLWNFAATESIKGAKIDRTNDEGIKLASKHFQLSAGIIEYIKTEISPHLTGSMLSGLTPEGLQLSSQLMLAQGIYINLYFEFILLKLLFIFYFVISNFYL